MQIIEKLKLLFNKKSEKVSESEPPKLINDAEMPAAELVEVPFVEQQTLPAESIPYWLDNEDALRDEGVIFGLSETPAEEKIGVIKTYFAHQTADTDKEVERLSEKIGELNLFIEQKEARINELLGKTKQLETRQPVEHNALRTAVGLVLSLGMCVGNYFLIDESLQTSFQLNHAFVAIGVFLAGMFNLFNPTSFLHEKDTKISWRQVLEEIGMPLAASVFVFVQVFESQSLLKSFALLFFVFFLFLFAGKLLLSNLAVAKKDIGGWLGNLKFDKTKISNTKDWEQEIVRLREEIDELRVQKWQILPNLNKFEAEIARINGKRDMLIKLFESEFKLARSYREKLSAKQILNIIE